MAIADMLAYKGGDYRVVASDLEWYLSVGRWGERGAVLLGQRKGLRTSFSGGAGSLNFFLDKIFKDEYFETEKGSFSAESPKGRG